MANLFNGADWQVIAWSASLAALTGWSNMRINRRQATEEDEKPGIADVVADTLIGTTAGLVLALGVPEFYPKLHSLGGVTALACVGGVGGRRVYDLGLSLLEYAARLRLGVKDDDKPTLPPPAPPKGGQDAQQ